MTFETFGHIHLTTNGMNQEEASKVMALAKKDVTLESMSERWEEDIQGYPQPMKGVFLVALDRIAAKYIDENMPHAWFRPLFAGR